MNGGLRCSGWHDPTAQNPNGCGGQPHMHELCVEIIHDTNKTTKGVNSSYVDTQKDGPTTTKKNKQKKAIPAATLMDEIRSPFGTKLIGGRD
jgi:hypothetical protein